MTSILVSSLALFIFSCTATAAPRGKSTKPSSPNAQAKAVDLEASLPAVNAAAVEEHARTRALFEQEKAEIARIQSDQDRTEDEKRTEIRRIKKDFVGKRNAVRLAARMQFRKRYLESSGASAAGGSR